MTEKEIHREVVRGLHQRPILSPGQRAGHRKYSVTRVGFELVDVKKYSYNEIKGLPQANPYALDAVNAAQTFKETKDRTVKAAEADLKQMVAVRAGCDGRR
jgi:hypothetical protein